MKILIQQRDINYFIYRDDGSTPILSGGWEQQWLTIRTKLFDPQGKLRLEVKNKFRFDFWNTSYSINSPVSGVNGTLRPIKIWKGHWQLLSGDDRYDYFMHKGHKRSLLKNGVQVASYDKRYFHLFERDTFLIEADPSESVELIVAFELCFDLGTHNDGSTATLDLGNLSNGAIDHDPTWKPERRSSGSIVKTSS